MDGLSAVASVIAVIQLAHEIGKGFHGLREMWRTDLPGRLQSLSTQVTDLIFVLEETNMLLSELADNDLSQQQQGAGGPAQETRHLDEGEVTARLHAAQLHRAQTEASIRQFLAPCPRYLSSLRSIIEELRIPSKQSSRTAGPVQQFKSAYSWRKHLPHLNEIHQQINAVKASLILILGKETWDQNRNIQVQLVGMQTHFTHLIQSQSPTIPSIDIEKALREFQASARKRDDSLHETIRRVEERMMAIASTRPTAGRLSVEQPFEQQPPAYTVTRRRPSIRPRGSVQQVQSVALQVTTRSSRCGNGNCRCVCHAASRIKTPGGFLNRVVGQLFLGYSGISSKCNLPSCEVTQQPEVTAEYWFPMGLLWSMIIQFNLSYQANMGPSFALKTLRRVPDSAVCVNYVINGNIDGLKGLFNKGLASPRDVSDTRGYSLLRWALYANQFETVRFLALQGADPDYRPKAMTDLSPRTKSNDLLLQGVGREIAEALMCVTGGDDWADEQGFTTLHRIVTGLSGKDLEEELREHPEDIDKVDGLGRSPISWAAARGNEKHVTMLLASGANPNILDVQLSGPVTYSADRSHAICTRLLLDAHAMTDPMLPDGMMIGSPLNCAARNAHDPAVIELLLQYGANPDATGVDRRTPLIHAARKNKASFAIVLLEYGANINAVASDGQTPLTTAIIHNSHDVLSLLLGRWHEYSSCPRLSGPHVIRVMAQYADARTIDIMSQTDHFRLRYDKDYSTGDFEAIIRARYDADEKLQAAFAEFMNTIRQEHIAEAQQHVRMQSEKMGYFDLEKGCSADDSDSSDEFFNALEE